MDIRKFTFENIHMRGSALGERKTILINNILLGVFKRNKYAIYAYTHGLVTGSALSPH